MEYPCDVCNVVTSSEEQLAVHMDGKRHRKHILMAEVTNSPVADTGAVDEELHCELCDVTAPSSAHKQIHLRWVHPISLHASANTSGCGSVFWGQFVAFVDFPG